MKQTKSSETFIYTQTKQGYSFNFLDYVGDYISRYNVRVHFHMVIRFRNSIQVKKFHTGNTKL